MRKLTTEEIAKLAQRKNVDAIAVSNFLNLMTGFESIEISKLHTDKELLNWNYRTVRAIRDGIGLAARKGDAANSTVVNVADQYGVEIEPGNRLKILLLDTGDGGPVWYSFVSNNEECFTDLADLDKAEAPSGVIQADWNELRAIIHPLHQKKEGTQCTATSQPSTELKSTGLTTVPANTNCTGSER